jgi:hypothetical protein
MSVPAAPVRTKHRRQIELADWLQEIVDLHTETFLRVLIHSDGCRSVDRVRWQLERDRWDEYPRYFFTTEPADIKGVFTDALDRLAIPWKRMNPRRSRSRGGRWWRGWTSSPAPEY